MSGRAMRCVEVIWATDPKAYKWSFPGWLGAAPAACRRMWSTFQIIRLVVVIFFIQFRLMIMMGHGGSAPALWWHKELTFNWDEFLVLLVPKAPVQTSYFLEMMHPSWKSQTGATYHT